MKKLVCILSFLISSFALLAQNPNAYRFSFDTTKYVELSGATVVGSKLLGKNFDSQWIVGDTGYPALTAAPKPAQRDSIMKGRGMAIGFDFPFAKSIFSHFGILSNGAIFLGNSADSILVGTSSYGAIYAQHTQNVISFAGSKDWVWSFDSTTPLGTPTTSISYKTEGNVGARTLTIQFKNLQYISSTNGYGATATPKTRDTLNFQICLHENGQIVCHIGKSVATNTNNRSMYVGFKSNSSVSPDYYTRSISSSIYNDQNWDNSLLGTNSSATCAFFNKKYPAEGLRYTFDTPIACVAPETIANTFEFSQLSNSTFKYSIKQNPNSNGSLVIWSKEAVLTFLPEEGVEYRISDTLGNGKGNGYVCGISTNVNNALEGKLGYSETLLPGTKYYLHAFALNNLCIGKVPVYANIAHVDSIVTLPDATNISLIASDSTKASFSLKIPKNHSALVFRSSKYPNEAVAPTKAMKVGDSLSDGSVLVYKGSESTILFNDLKQGSLNYFTTWTLATDSTYGPDCKIAGVQMIATRLPFTFNFADQLTGQTLGWKGDFNIFTTREPAYTLLATQIVKCSAGGDSCTKFPSNQIGLSSAVKLGTGKHRISFDYIIGNNGIPGGRHEPPVPMSGVALPANDSLIVSITTDGTHYMPIGSISSTEHTLVTADFTNQTMDINSKDLDSKFVQIQLKSVSTGSIPYYYFIRNLNVKQVLNECETPVNISITDSTITTTEAEVKWLDFKGTKYTQWNLSYKKTSDTNWSAPISINSNPYTLNSLNPQSTYLVRVQAVCSKESQSDWSSVSTPFTTQFGVPFGTDFAQAEWDTNFPIYWSRVYGKFSPTTGIAKNFTDAQTSWRWWNWKNIKEGGENAFRCAFANSATYWFMTPSFNLAKDNDVLLDFDLALMRGIGPDFVDTVNENARFLVIVSTDGGKSFDIKDTILGYGKACALKLGNIEGTHISLPLKKYNGKVKIGFYVENLGNGVDAFIQLAHLKVSPSCLPATTLTVSNIDDKSATLTWHAATVAPEWTIRYKKTQDPTFTYLSSTSNTINLTNLQASTTYDVGVRAVCKVGDSSTWLSDNFTTLNPRICDTVTRARRIDYDQTYAQIAWIGDALSYNFKYKKASETQWIPSKTKDTTILLENLTSNTEYVFSVQAQCTADTTDVSLWTTPGNFKTLGITCPLPDSIHLAFAKYGQATIRWKRVASAYQYSFKETKATRWEGGYIGDYTGVGINGLLASTNYVYKMRTICTTGDTSLWSPILEFSTTAKPECGIPTKLSVKEVTTTSATLSWTAGLNNFLYSVRGRANKDIKWDTIFMGTDKTSFIWANLKPETIYTWSVQSICDDYKYDPSISEWANTNFTTSPSSIEGEISLKDAFQVAAKDGQLHIFNLRQQRIDQIEIFNTMGQKLRTYPVNSSDNIIIPTTLNNNSVAIIRITTSGSTVNYKLYL